MFHTSLLRLDSSDPLLGQEQAEPALIRVQNSTEEGEGEHDEWEVEEIVDSRYRYGFLEYKVK